MNRFETPKSDLQFSVLPSSADLQTQKSLARNFFATLRDDICTAFEAIESENSSPTKFQRKKWQREGDEHGGGGEMSLMRGDIFEKVGVNISVVEGHFSEKFASEIPGAKESQGQFWAAGLSLVAHMKNPHVPAVHMNLRMICTGACWFGGGTDINAALPDEAVTNDFHKVLKEVCDKHGKDYYDTYKSWCDNYFYLPHRDEHRGQGGIFYDYLDSGDWHKDFTFTSDVGAAFLQIYPAIVRRQCGKTYTDDDLQRLLHYRGRYAEFNLLYDRGTRFGLQTGGNAEAILMSLPPVATW